tara:strand:- start:572 stop:1336 length:765 start_codon:yes stop_codon:yes gene_type:complete
LVYGTISIFLGIFWWLALKFLSCCYFLTNNKLDRNRKLPVLVSTFWGNLVMSLMRNNPTVHNRDLVMKTLKNRPCVFVANHSSWTDIMYVAAAISYKNYKTVAKKELLKVPILGTALRVSSNVILDRSNRRSQLEAYKLGLRWLERGVPLMTFAEGTRSRDGRFQNFKRGAFKMALVQSVPIVPMSICYSQVVNPLDFVFPIRPGKSFARVIFHQPIETDDLPTMLTPDEKEAHVMKLVQESINGGLPHIQKQK